MLDIIIPVYKAKKTLLRLLMSIAVQKDAKNYKVYLVIDADKEDYSEEIKFIESYYSISILNLNINSGPGVARQYGINNSNNPYIMFMDADDYFYNPFSLSKILREIKLNDFDLLISNFKYERDNEFLIKKKDVTWLHGKVYRRKFLDENNIMFNNSRANEDNGFNRLFLLNNPKIKYLDDITYVYSENSESITRKNNREYKFWCLEYLAYNINWAMDIMIKKNKNLNSVSRLSLNLLVALYYYYLEYYGEYDVERIIEWSKDTYNIYMLLKEKITKSDLYNALNDKENEYSGKHINKLIMFDEFLKKVSEYNDRCNNSSI